MSHATNHAVDQQPKPKYRQGSCMAYHCPLSATMFNSVRGGNGCCSYHYKAKMKDWPVITRTLRANKLLLQRLSNVKGLTALEFREQRPRLEVAKYPLKQGETKYEYIKRIDNCIRQRVTGALQSQPKPNK